MNEQKVLEIMSRKYETLYMAVLAGIRLALDGIPVEVYYEVNEYTLGYHYGWLAQAYGLNRIAAFNPNTQEFWDWAEMWGNDPYDMAIQWVEEYESQLL